MCSGVMSITSKMTFLCVLPGEVVNFKHFLGIKLTILPQDLSVKVMVKCLGTYTD